MDEGKLLGIRNHIAEIIGIDSKDIVYKKDFNTDIHAFKFYIDEKKIFKVTDEALKDLSIEELAKRISSSKFQFKNEDEVLIHTES